jgi:hypothetical protein
VAPTVIAEITLSSSPSAEITMISVSGKRCRTSRISSTPWPSGSLRSVSSTRGVASPSADRASPSVPALRTS